MMLDKMTIKQILEARMEILYLWCDEGRDVMEMDEEAVVEAVWRLINKRDNQVNGVDPAKG